ncbi:hypothetical protein BJF79_29035 [Actinomadura sp. CNU-125]|uniref:hypothetical protein n=1 Tax=Actinomadura sp. CNU-125 TaxID=1904961 RepID=UPI00095CA8A9|nr:hypothetical protein [Actinomadura sp. CNU-125]OLT37782.1 hypothetical protein BJF79_29035 [Actinomadura sp. CNU-125]
MVPEHDYEDGLDADELVQNALTGVLIHLYEQEEPIPLATLLAAMIDHIGEQYVFEEEGAAVSQVLGDAFVRELGVLQEWGIVEPAGEDGRALTPLAVWAVRELLVADGFLAPVVGDLADATAAELVAGLVWHRTDTADEEIDGWLARRDAAAAAAELLDVIRTGGPGARNLARRSCRASARRPRPSSARRATIRSPPRTRRCGWCRRATRRAGS